MFGGLPATGAIARTATNIRAGAQSPVAGMIHSLTLLCILLFAAPLVSYVPMAALAGILMVVAYNMGEWREIPQLLKLTKTDISVWLVTFALTVFADLTVAVEAGMILAALLFISRVAATTTVSQVTDDYVEDGRVHILQDKDIPYYATIFRIHGPFLFGATDKIAVVTEKIHKLPPVVILRLRNMTALDATGLFALEEIAKQLQATGRTLLLCGASEQPAKLIHQAEFEEVIGAANICENVQQLCVAPKKYSRNWRRHPPRPSTDESPASTTYSALPNRSHLSPHGPKIIRRCQQDLHSTYPCRHRNYIKQLDRLIHENRIIFFPSQRRHSSADVTCQPLKFLHWYQLNLAIARRRGERLQIEFGIPGNHRHADSVPVSTRDQRFENLLWRKSNLLRDCFRCQVVGIYFVFPQLIVNAELIQQASRIRLVCHCSIVFIVLIRIRCAGRTLLECPEAHRLTEDRAHASSCSM